MIRRCSARTRAGMVWVIAIGWSLLCLMALASCKSNYLLGAIFQ